jgi:hypothetical protein
LQWNLEIINPVDPEIKLTIIAFDGRYLGADVSQDFFKIHFIVVANFTSPKSNGVVLIDRLFEWIGSYHGDGWL